MTRGVLIFAFNNEHLDYYLQANWVADRVNRYLELPVTIVTDTNSIAGRESKHDIVLAEPEALGQRNFDPHGRNNVDYWYNATRFQAYELSPYDETIIIDSDYIVSSDQLLLLFDSPHDFLVHRNVRDVCVKGSFGGLVEFGSTRMPHYWATVLFFRKTAFAKQIFSYIAMIKANFKYYGELYKFRSHIYRNDYAVSIAQLIAYGHRIDAVPTIPWQLMTAAIDVDAKMLADDEFELTYDTKWVRNKQRPLRTKIKGQDWHCLNKLTMEKMINGS